MVQCSFWSLLSYAIGSSSVIIWLCAQLPQIYKNWKRKSMEGLSPLFLTAWVAGDASNLLGCLLTGQLGVQVTLASYYCLVDIILISQYILYLPRVEYIDAYTPASDQLADTSLDNTARGPQKRSSSFWKSTVLKVCAVASLSDPVAASVTSTPNSLSKLASLHDRTSMSSSSRLLDSERLGFLIAYFSMFMYLFSRIPQILENFRRKSTRGVSMYLFISAFMGNLTYATSILVSPKFMCDDTTRWMFLLHELPYILGAVGTMAFDCIILAQWYFYQRRAMHRRRSTRPYDLLTSRSIQERQDMGPESNTNLADTFTLPPWSTPVSERVELDPSDLRSRVKSRLGELYPLLAAAPLEEESAIVD